MKNKQWSLPLMGKVFDALRKGRHICHDDGELFLALRDNKDEYEELFTNLGFNFREHRRGFFFFEGESQLGEIAERMAVFMFILIEDISTRGIPVEEALMTRLFDPGELPHFQGERSRQYMKQVGISGPDDLSNLLKRMEMYGFMKVQPNGSFRFRTPVCRFLELCTEFIDEADDMKVEDRDE